MSTHGNSLQNESKHHLYAIRDKLTEEAHKFGICGFPLRADGSSERAENQVSLFNQIAGWDRFFAVILQTEIEGRTAARILEDEYIENWKARHGVYPPGNQDHKKLKRKN